MFGLATLFTTKALKNKIKKYVILGTVDWQGLYSTNSVVIDMCSLDILYWVGPI